MIAAMLIFLVLFVSAVITLEYLETRDAARRHDTAARQRASHNDTGASTPDRRHREGP